MLQRLGEGRQFAGLARVAEVGIERLLDDAQIGEDFLGDLVEQQFFLGLARHFVELWHFHRRQWFAAQRGIQAVAHRGDLLGELLVQALEAIEGVVHQQERGRHLQAERVVVTERRLAQFVGGRQDQPGEARQIGMFEFVGAAGYLAYPVVELG